MARGGDKKGSGVIIRKYEIIEGGHHGGAWKVAYADFVTAMMAFFLLMWLLNATTEDQRKGLETISAPITYSVTHRPVLASRLAVTRRLTMEPWYPIAGRLRSWRASARQCHPPLKRSQRPPRSAAGPRARRSARPRRTSMRFRHLVLPRRSPLATKWQYS